MPQVWVPLRKQDYPGQRNKVGKDKMSSMYSDNFKLKVLTTYLATGNYLLTAKIFNISEHTIREQWSKQNWWHDTIDQIKDAEHVELDSKLKKIVEKSLSSLEDRLEKGDMIFTKDGLMRVPVKARDLNNILKESFNQRVVLLKEKNAKEHQIVVEKQQDRLIRLAEEFAKIAHNKIPTQSQVLEAEYKVLEKQKENDNALHDQREERLQEGIELGAHEGSKQSEGQSNEEQGQSNDEKQSGV